VRFGINISTSAGPGADPVAAAQRAEALGFDFVSASDHLHGSHPTFETWTLLAWIAARTARIQIVSNVLGLPYRAPAVIAKMGESLARLSGGRYVLGLGAGGSDDEFRAFGLPVRTAGEKVDALEEALTIVRGLWSGAEYSFEGEHYATHGARLEPKPDAPIPIWLGVYGRRSLTLAGRYADGWLPSLPYAPPAVVPEMRDRVRSAAEAAGRDPAALTFAYNLGVHVGSGVRSERVVSGNPAEVVERLREIADLGFDTLNFWPVGNEAEQAEALAREVVPHLA